MSQSEKIGELAKALSAAVAKMKPPTKGRTAQIRSEKGAYSYKYADLADVIESYRGPLSQHGLSLVQPIRTQDGHMILETRLLHESGEWISSEYPVANYARPQEMGSALTYARRYAVTALLGIAAEDDDDGERAQNATPQPIARQEKTEAAKPKDGISDADIEKVGALAKRAGYAKHADIKPLLQTIGGVDSLRMLERRYLPELIATLERKGDEIVTKDVEEVFGVA